MRERTAGGLNLVPNCKHDSVRHASYAQAARLPGAHATLAPCGPLAQPTAAEPPTSPASLSSLSSSWSVRSSSAYVVRLQRKPAGLCHRPKSAPSTRQSAARPVTCAGRERGSSGAGGERRRFGGARRSPPVLEARRGASRGRRVCSRGRSPRRSRDRARSRRRLRGGVGGRVASVCGGLQRVERLSGAGCVGRIGVRAPRVTMASLQLARVQSRAASDDGARSSEIAAEASRTCGGRRREDGAS